MRTLLASLLVVAFVSASSADEEFVPRDLGPTLEALIVKYHLPGAVGAIVRGDRLVALGAAGQRKLGEQPSFLATDLIHLGSDTKAMTAILIGQLIERQQLSLDAAMRDVFPDLAGKIDPAMARITVRDLLNHTAGLPHDLEWGLIAATHLPLPAQRKLAVGRALYSPPATPIGKYAYSNVGYVILGAIIEAKAGKSWEEVIAQEIFRPLHMDSAGFGPPGTPGQIDQPWGHTVVNGKLTPTQMDNPPVMGPAGTVHCSIGDWAKFVAEIMHGVQGHPTLVRPETFKELVTYGDDSDHYTSGWIVTRRPWGDGLVLTHSGSNTTWFCTVWIAPKKDFAVLIAINAGGETAAKAADKGEGKLIAIQGQ